MFSKANNKLKKLYSVRWVQRFLQGRKIYSFDLASGYSCPFAKDCKSQAVKTRNGLRIVDGPKCKFRCFSASEEALFTSVYNRRQRNYKRIREAEDKAAMILSALPKNAGIIRIHAGGDFFSQQYFDAWLEVARMRPNVLFYAYTKAIRFWQRRKKHIPPNLVLTASHGGTQDCLIGDLRTATVVYSKVEAKRLGLPIDSNDSHAANPNGKSFALMIHGVQPLGTLGAKVVYRQRHKG